MERTMKKDGGRTWTWIGCGLVAALGASVLAIGATQPRLHLVFGGAVLLLIAASLVLQERALRPGRDDAAASNAEKAAWSQLGMGLAAILVLGGVSLGSTGGVFAPYLLLAAYVLVVAFFPAFRRRFIEENRRYREVAEDERDRAIRAQGDYLSKRLLEFALVALAIAWALAPQLVQSLGGPLRIAAVLLLPIVAANTVGEARVAFLHWRDRQ